MREIDVIDVARQEDYKMLMREWTEYYASPNRHKILNVISLEFTNTKLVSSVELCHLSVINIVTLFDSALVPILSFMTDKC